MIPYLVLDVEGDWQSQTPTNLTPEQVMELNEFLHQAQVLDEFEDLLWQMKESPND